MQRRKFLTLLGFGVTSAVVLPTVGFASVTAKEAAVHIIMGEFSYLALEKQGVEQFVDDYLAYDTFTPRLDLKLKSYHLLGIKSNRSSVINSITNKYLLSTDFFMNKMNESKAVKYLGFYNPHKSPCANPFSYIYYPPEEITLSDMKS
jgi:hypothetical protein